MKGFVMNRTLKHILTGACAVAGTIIAGFAINYRSRFKTMSTVTQLTDYEDGYNLYRIDVSYDYDLDHLVANGVMEDSWSVQAILKESLPKLPVHMESPKFGCSCFGITDANGDVLMGRNYDFKNDTSVMLVRCAPKDGYASIGFAALDNVKVIDADASIKDELTSLTAPFICLDGINEMGVSIAVLTLDSTPTSQANDREGIFTTLAIRLVLDRAATTQEAVDLLHSYDMHAIAGRDYHFFINDASCDSRVVEWDCDSKTREMVVTPTRTCTNFFVIHKDKVTSDGKNGIYGHGKDRYDRIEAILTGHEGSYSRRTAWDCLQAAQQLPNDEDITSNTQWSIVYDNSKRTAEVVVRRHWDDAALYGLDGCECGDHVRIETGEGRK